LIFSSFYMNKSPFFFFYFSSCRSLCRLCQPRRFGTRVASSCNP
jgi:hypothetical protein